jgi:hypothetical protein
MVTLLIRRQRNKRNVVILPFYLIRDGKLKNNISRRRVKSISWWKVLLRISSLTRILDEWPCLWLFFKRCAAVIGRCSSKPEVQSYHKFQVLEWHRLRLAGRNDQLAMACSDIAPFRMSLGWVAMNGKAALVPKVEELSE